MRYILCVRAVTVLNLQEWNNLSASNNGEKGERKIVLGSLLRDHRSTLVVRSVRIALSENSQVVF
jgi:hypothetical protein